MFTSNPNLSFSQEGEPEITQPTEADLCFFYRCGSFMCYGIFFLVFIETGVFTVEKSSITCAVGRIVAQWHLLRQSLHMLESLFPASVTPPY